MIQPPEGLVQTTQGFYVLRNDTHLSRWVEEHGRLDVAEGQIAFYKEFIPVGGLVADAGASLGDHTMTYAKLVGPTGRVAAIEPNPLAYEALCLNFDRWKNVVTFNYALSDVLDFEKMTRHPNAGMSHLGADMSVADIVEVNCQTLDYLLAGVERLDLIHLDCEGWEPRALSGASNLIAKFKPAIVLEINHACLARVGSDEQAVLRRIDEMGYRWRELEPHLNTSFPQRDILATPK